jgi:hypothetical protein
MAMVLRNAKLQLALYQQGQTGDEVLIPLMDPEMLQGASLQAVVVANERYRMNPSEFSEFSSKALEGAKVLEDTKTGILFVKSDPGNPALDATDFGAMKYPRLEITKNDFQRLQNAGVLTPQDYFRDNGQTVTLQYASRLIDEDQNKQLRIKPEYGRYLQDGVAQAQFGLEPNVNSLVSSIKGEFKMRKTIVDNVLNLIGEMITVSSGGALNNDVMKYVQSTHQKPDQQQKLADLVDMFMSDKLNIDPNTLSAKETEIYEQGKSIWVKVGTHLANVMRWQYDEDYMTVVQSLNTVFFNGNNLQGILDAGPVNIFYYLRQYIEGVTTQFIGQEQQRLNQYLQSAMGQMQQQGVTMSNEYQTAVAKYQVGSGKLAEVNEKLEKVRQKAQDAIEAKRIAQNEALERERLLNQKNLDYHALLLENQAMRIQLGTLSTQGSAVQATTSDLQKKYEELLLQYGQQAGELKALSSKSDKTEEESKKLQELQKINAKLQSENSAAAATLRELRMRLEKYEKSETQLVQYKQTTEKESGSQLSQLIAANAKLEGELASSKQALETEQRHSADLQKQSSDAIARMQKQIDGLNQQLNEARRSNSDAVNNKSLEQMLTALNASQEQIKKSSESANGALLTALQTVSVDPKDSKLVDMLQERLRAMEQLHTEQTKEWMDQVRILSTQTHIQPDAALLRTLESQLQRMSEENAKKDDRISQLLNQNLELGNKSANLDSRINGTRQELVRQYEARIQALQAEKEKALLDLQTFIATKEASRNAMQAALDNETKYQKLQEEFRLKLIERDMQSTIPDIRSHPVYLKAKAKMARLKADMIVARRKSEEQMEEIAMQRDLYAAMGQQKDIQQIKELLLGQSEEFDLFRQASKKRIREDFKLSPDEIAVATEQKRLQKQFDMNEFKKKYKSLNKNNDKVEELDS